MVKDKHNYAQGETAPIPKENSSETGEWKPMIDWSVVFPGNRGLNRKQQYELHDGPVGIKLRIEEASKSAPILFSEEDWEGDGGMNPSSVWKTGERYHLLYMASEAKNHQSSSLGGLPDEVKRGGLGYAYSDDGYNWIRPALGQVEFNGSSANNKIANAPKGTPFVDPNGTPEERFKAIGQEGSNFDPDTGEQLSAAEAYKRMKAMEYEGVNYKGPRMQMRHWISGWSSPDGIIWKKTEKPVANVPSDGGTAAQYDPETGGYYAYIRVEGMGRRATGLAKTADFWDWPLASLVLAPDPQDDPDVSFYGANYFRYPGSNDLHCMFLLIYHQVADLMDNQIAFSRNGIHWNRPERKAIIPLGVPGSGEDCHIRSWGGLIELPDGYWATPFEGASWLHNSIGYMPQHRAQISWARWKPHRFCGIDADTEGRFTIPTVKRARNELRLNYRCKPGGWVSIELIHALPSRLHPDAEGIPGYTFDECIRLTGDEISAVVAWKGGSDISALGSTVAVRIRMFGAKIFAYSV